MAQEEKQLTCACGKQFTNRNELEKHRATCATAQASGQAGATSRMASGGQQVRGAGGSQRTDE